MKKIILMIFCVLSTTLFAEIQDDIGMFTKEEQATIEQKIEKLEKEKGIKVFLNTVIGKESFQNENPQKTFIIIYQKFGDDFIVTELKFTEDLKMGDKSQEIDIILDELKEKMYDKKYLDYTLETIDKVGNLIVVEEESDEDHFPEDSGEVKKSFFQKIFSKNP